jgi:hypothetical protein
MSRRLSDKFPDFIQVFKIGLKNGFAHHEVKSRLHPADEGGLFSVIEMSTSNG